MDISLAKLDRPRLEAKFCPIYWEPQAGSNERVTSLVAIVPLLESAGHFAPAAHCILSAPKLRAMLGTVRGTSAHGILREAADFMTKQLAAGLELEELSAPFSGFLVGEPRRVRGFTAEQLLTAAVNMVATFGNAEELIDEALPADGRLATATTREFLAAVKKRFAGDAKSIKKRFHHKYSATGISDITLDYQHKQWLVQFASLPANPYQAPHMQREAESKMFEILTARQTIAAPTQPLLIVNSRALQLTADTPEYGLLSRNMLNRFKDFAEVHKIEVFPADSEMAAVHRLELIG